MFGIQADQTSTRVPNHPSCVDERRRRFTTTRFRSGVEVYLFFFHASGSLDDLRDVPHKVCSTGSAIGELSGSSAIDAER